MNLQFIAAMLGIHLVRFFEYDSALVHPVHPLPAPLTERLVEPVWWWFCWGAPRDHDRFRASPDAALTNIWSRGVYQRYQRLRRERIWSDQGFVDQRLAEERKAAEEEARVAAVLRAEETRRQWGLRQAAEAQKRAARKARQGGL